MNMARMPGRVPDSRVGAIALMRRRTATATASSRPARAAMANTPRPAAVTARCASGPNSRRRRGHQPGLVRLGAGEQQRVQAQHRRLVVVGATLLGQQGR